MGHVWWHKVHRRTHFTHNNTFSSSVCGCHGDSMCIRHGNWRVPVLCRDIRFVCILEPLVRILITQSLRKKEKWVTHRSAYQVYEDVQLLVTQTERERKN